FFENENFFSEPNVNHFRMDTPHIDFLPEDGWELLAENMGRPGDYDSAVQYPTFFLYNRYTGKLRLFLYYRSPDDIILNGAKSVF
ncbi:MAG: hypothetical protein HC842_06805, partial [Cytophagales bacterium]|nr:hypothetical protein [Cytophagales bacterium]